MISKETIAQIQDASRIEEVVSDFLTLKKRGANYIACCPFHNEKTPSFNVNPARNIYKCFGCSKGGDSVSFVMEHEKMNYPEALRYLAKKYNIPIEEVYDKNAEEEKKLEGERESLFLINAYAQIFFTDTLLHSAEGKAIGLSYFKERGLKPEVIEKFQLGYAPEARTALTDAALKGGYNIDYLVKSGLTIRPDDNPERIYDRFAGRVMFPICSITGRVLGFGGRALRKDAKAKYVNSPESTIYHKSNILYGLNVARKAIVTQDHCYLVEGYMDVLSMHQSGIENIVASSGTSLTIEQIRLIKRYTPNITIMYDGDAAGIKASFRGINMILEEGMNVRVVLFPEGDDPDSFARKHSESEIKKFIEENKNDFIRFKAQLLYQESKHDPIKKAGLIQEIVESIALIPNSITRNVFIQECSRIMQMDEQALLTELNKVLRKHFSKFAEPFLSEDLIHIDNPAVPQPIDTDIHTLEYNEKEIIRLLLLYGNRSLEIASEVSEEENNTEGTTHEVLVAELITSHLSADNIEFENKIYQQIYNEYATEKDFGLNYFIHHKDSTLSQTAIDITTFPYSISDWKKKHGIDVQKEEDILKSAVEHAIYSLKVKKILRMIDEVQKQLQETTSEEDMMILIDKKKQLDKAKNTFSKELGWIILK